jgi:hypothetical protein
MVAAGETLERRFGGVSSKQWHYLEDTLNGKLDT